MNIFITGATGFIGSVFLKTLLPTLHQDDRVFVLVRSLRQYTDKRVVQLVGTLEAIHNFKETIVTADYFFHIAAKARLKGGGNYQKVNVEPVREIVSTLKNATHFKKIIFISSIAAVGRAKKDMCKFPISTRSEPSPATEYGCSKLAAEKCVIESGLPFVIIRPAGVWGKNMHAESHVNKFVSMVYHKNPFVFFGFPGRISVIHVEDLAAALVQCIPGDKSTGKIYFAATESPALGHIFAIIYKNIYKSQVKQISVPRFYPVLSKIHRLIPLAGISLFLDYLWARDDAFHKDLLKDITVKKIDEYIGDVISTNITVIND